MIAGKTQLDRLGQYARHLGIGDGPIGIKSTVGPRIRSYADTEEPERPDFVAFANTDDIDLSDEVVDPRGADTTYIMANRKVFANHNYENDDVVGHLRWVKAYPDVKAHRAWQVRFKLTTNRAGETVRKMIEETGGIGLSVGFYARSYGPPTDEEVKAYSVGSKRPKSIVRAWDWFELSATCLPCNVACQTKGMVLDGNGLIGMERLVTKGLIARDMAARLGLPIGAERKSFRIGYPDGTVAIKSVV